MTYRLVLMHPMDPRGAKLGGIETHVRLILSRHPADFSVLFVGVDEFGDCALGKARPLDVDGRRVDFLPVAHIPHDAINLASRTILGSTTFRFAAGAMRHLLAIRKAIGPGPASADLQRFEFAMIARLLGLPAVQMVHGEGSRDDKMDSLIKTYWFAHRFNERVALTLAKRILCVNPNIVKRMQREFPTLAPKAEVMTVSVDTRRFAPQPFDCADGVFRIVFAGRLDEFKDPPLMFRVMAKLHQRLNGALEFHYVGASDPARYPEFEAIRAFSVLHGLQSATGVAAIVAKCHAGVLTSFFEGMPCYLLETLSLGRPFAAIRLPQYDPLIVEGVSGEMVERTDPDLACESDLVDAFARLREDVFARRLDPLRIHARVQPYSVETQMARLFEHHRALQGGGAASPRAAQLAAG
jgi:glycosyltransferase involved in cell wall biosynthesis